jgi:hypothetical protein
LSDARGFLGDAAGDEHELAADYLAQPASYEMGPPPAFAGTLVGVMAGLLIVVLVLLGAIALLQPKPRTLTATPRLPGTAVEQAFVQAIGRDGYEVAYLPDDVVAVLVPASRWQSLGSAGRFEQHRFLSGLKATLVRLQADRGDRRLYRMAILEAATQRMLAEETDFNPRFYE